MGVRNLIRKPIVDKNGKNTTVLVRPDQGSNDRASAAPVPQSSGPFIPVIPPSPEPFAPKDPNSKMLSSWNGEKLQPVKIVTETGGQWELAPEGFSGAKCFTCGSFFTDEQVSSGSYIKCLRCLKETRGGRIESGIRYSDVHLLSQEATRENDWYHITLSANWDTDITTASPMNQPYVHVGSLAAAETRMKDLVDSHKSSERFSKHLAPSDDLVFYCYRIKMVEDADLSPNIITDADFDAPESVAQIRAESLKEDGESYAQYELFGATRYVNEYESHGSISLITHPTAIEVVERFVMER